MLLRGIEQVTRSSRSCLNCARGEDARRQGWGLIEKNGLFDALCCCHINCDVLIDISRIILGLQSLHEITLV